MEGVFFPIADKSYFQERNGIFSVRLNNLHSWSTPGLKDSQVGVKILKFFPFGKNIPDSFFFEIATTQESMASSLSSC